MKFQNGDDDGGGSGGGDDDDGGRHTDTRTFHFAIPTPLTPSRPRRCATHLRGAATSSAFQRRDEFCERVLHMHRTAATVNEAVSKVITPGYVLMIATRTPTAVVVFADRGEKEGEKDFGADRPAGRSVASEAARRQLEERRRRCALPVP